MIKRFLPVAIVVAAAIVLALGLTEGSLGVVWQKAAQVCLECIGVG